MYLVTIPEIKMYGVIRAEALILLIIKAFRDKEST